MGQQTYIIPHYAVGDGWSTRFIMKGTNATEVAQVVLRDANGNEVGRSMLSNDYAIGHTFTSDGPLVTGSIEVTCLRSAPTAAMWEPCSFGADPAIHAVFSYNRDGQMQEAAARHDIPSNHKYLVADPESGHKHGIALVNTESYPIKLRVQAGRFEGNCLRLLTKTVQPHAQLVFTLEDAIPSLASGVCASSGLVSISGDYGYQDAKFSVVAFRFNKSGLFTNVPIE